MYLVDADTLADMVIEVLSRRHEIELQHEKEEVIDRTRQLSGLASIASSLGISKTYLATLRENKVFTKEAIWQECDGGKVYADPELLKQQWIQFRHNHS